MVLECENKGISIYTVDQNVGNISAFFAGWGEDDALLIIRKLIKLFMALGMCHDKHLEQIKVMLPPFWQKVYLIVKQHIEKSSMTH